MRQTSQTFNIHRVHDPRVVHQTAISALHLKLQTTYLVVVLGHQVSYDQVTDKPASPVEIEQSKSCVRFRVGWQEAQKRKLTRTSPECAALNKIRATNSTKAIMHRDVINAIIKRGL